MFSFFDAIYEGNVQAVHEYLKADAALVQEGTPVLLACNAEHYEIADLLLSFGADPSERDGDGETPLHIAAFNGLEKISELLIRSGADVNAATEEGKTILMNAAQSGKVAIIRMLLKAGAQTSCSDNNNNNELHWACVGDHDNKEVISLLLDAGSDQNKQNDIGDTPLQYARDMQKTDIINEFLKHSEKI